MGNKYHNDFDVEDDFDETGDLSGLSYGTTNKVKTQKKGRSGFFDGDNSQQKPPSRDRRTWETKRGY